MKRLAENIPIFLIFTIIAYLIYFNTLNNEFAMEDKSFLTEGVAAGDISGLAEDILRPKQRSQEIVHYRPV